MCIFTGEVEQVSATQIFARHLDDGRQAIIYAMSVVAPREVAMVLPVPIAPGGTRTSGSSALSGEHNPVEFFDLSGYHDLFDDLAKTFEVPFHDRHSDLELLFEDEPQGTLVVHEVGAFSASFVPSRADFARLDRRFRIPDRVFTKVPAYADFGFAVFQLRADDYLQDIHPMAFAFPTRAPNALYFPTLHVHDGATPPPAATFDHTLYCQRPTPPKTWERSESAVEGDVDLERAKGLIAKGPAYRRTMRGTFVNEDIWG